MTCRLGTFGTTEPAAYLSFAAACFGPNSYQARPEYLKWLYSECPVTSGMAEDFHVAMTGTGMIVGCVHVMRTPWKFREEIVAMPALHNTMIVPEFRRGLGGMLLMQSFRKEKHAFSPGTIGPISDGIKRLGFSPLPTVWRARWLRPGYALWSIALKRIRPTWKPKARGWPRVEKTGKAGELHWSMGRPRLPGEVEEIVRFANARWNHDQVFGQFWTPETLWWRFFHPHGPEHCLFAFKRDGALVAYVIMSLGLRRGLVIARVVDYGAPDRADLDVALATTVVETRQAGAHLFLVFTGHAEYAAALVGSGLSTWKRHPATQILHRDSSLKNLPHSFMPSAGDYGLEAFVDTRH